MALLLPVHPVGVLGFVYLASLRVNAEQEFAALTIERRQLQWVSINHFNRFLTFAHEAYL